MSIPDYQTLMLPVLKASADGEVRIGGVVAQMCDQFALTEDERAEVLPSGKQTVIANRVHWAKTYVNRRGWSRQPDGAIFRYLSGGRNYSLAARRRSTTPC